MLLSILIIHCNYKHPAATRKRICKNWSYWSKRCCSVMKIMHFSIMYWKLCCTVIAKVTKVLSTLLSLDRWSTLSRSWFEFPRPFTSCVARKLHFFGTEKDQLLSTLSQDLQHRSNLCEKTDFIQFKTNYFYTLQPQ